MASCDVTIYQNQPRVKTQSCSLIQVTFLKTSRALTFQNVEWKAHCISKLPQKVNDKNSRYYVVAPRAPGKKIITWMKEQISTMKIANMAWTL